MTSNKFIFVLLSLLFFSCSKNADVPKPIGNLRLSYPKNQYNFFKEQTSPFEFQKSIYTKLELREKQGWVNLHYPTLNATLYITYSPIKNNLYQLIKDTEKLTFDKHTIKAIEINGQPYENKQSKVYGTLFRLMGNTATNLQFYASDSAKHFMSGALYFRTKPNYDSLLPAIDYVEKDIKTLMESIKWRR